MPTAELGTRHVTNFKVHVSREQASKAAGPLQGPGQGRSEERAEGTPAAEP